MDYADEADEWTWTYEKDFVADTLARFGPPADDTASLTFEQAVHLYATAYWRALDYRLAQFDRDLASFKERWR